MPAVLVISKDKVQIEKVSVDGPRFVMGRSSSCDLTLNDSMLSREHCIITEEAGSYTVADNGSRNGTVLNSKPVTHPVKLKDGDRIALGGYELTFYASESDAPQVDASAGYEEDAATRFAGAEDIAAASGQAKVKAPISEGVKVKVSVESGPLKGMVFKDWSGNLNIGRGGECEVSIPDDAVSTLHARIFKEAGRFWVEDFNSANGTFVANVRVREKQELKNGDKIRIGITLFEYSEVDPVRQKALRKKILIGAGAVMVILVIAKIFQPEDKVAKYLLQADYHLEQGEFEDAIVLYEQVLAMSPSQSAALAGLSRANSQAEAAQFLAEAKQAALEERYAEALDICHRVLRLHPGHEEATEFLEVVRMVEESKVATDARNWPDAILLIEQALESYPDSDVLLTGLKRARSEQAATAGLAESVTLIAQKKFPEARDRVAGIAESSIYYEEAQLTLRKLAKLEEAESAFQSAAAAFRDGQEAAAMTYITQGLTAYPDYPDLVKLRKDIEQVAPIARRIAGSEALLESSDIPAIWEMVNTCESVMKIRIESDEVAKIRISSAEFAEQLKGRLKTISKNEMDLGSASLRQNDTREALQHFMRSAEADPGNEVATLAVNELHTTLTPLAKEHFRQAMVHEELEQIELAIQEYEEVLRIAVPGDTYYDRALTRLKRLQQ